MSESVPHLDYDMVARYEWFRRAVWGQSEQAWLNPLFISLVRENACASCLFAGGALGRTALAFAKLNPGIALSVFLPSSYGAERAREIAKANNLACSLLSGDRSELAGDIPHPADCVFSPNWMTEPEWNILKTHFESAYAALNPGGIIAFPAPRPGRDWRQMLSIYDRWDDDTVLWHFRDGAKECLCLRGKEARAENYADVKYRFIGLNRDTSVVETTVKRLPAYWSWDIARELAEGSGFIDCSAYGAEGETEEASVLFVARKPGKKKSAAASGEMRAYADF